MAPERVVVIGAGFGGIGASLRLLERGHNVTVLERASDLGGTWRDNVYPGCGCDVPSHLYSFSFAPNPDWSRNYSAQSEIEAYLHRVVDEADLRRHIRFDAEVTELRWSDRSATWRLDLSSGETLEADVVVSATGPLTRPSFGGLEGLELFEGNVCHTARWDTGHDVADRRVAVIGTGASAVQLIPRLAGRAAHVDVYQRSAPWVLPRRDAAISMRRRRWFRRLPLLQRLVRWRIYLRLELFVMALLGNEKMRKLAEDASARWRASQIDDPELRRTVTPDYPMGCKRIVISDDYYAALTRDDVSVIAEPIEQITADGIAAGGQPRRYDTIVCATGYHATDFLAPVKVFGRDGVELSESWRNGAATHLGITAAGFPNLFLVVGPNTALGHSSLVFMIECQVRFITSALDHLDASGADALEVTESHMRASTSRLHRRMTRTVWVAGCSSWYRSESGRVDTLWPGTTIDYWRRTRRFRRIGYRTWHAGSPPTRAAARSTT